MNARFWQYINGSPVKLTLKPGQVLTHATVSRHDEGWSSEQVDWAFDGRVVSRDTFTDGTDCDGRLSREYHESATPEMLKSGPQHDGVVYPEWHDDGRSQRDYSAEAMGY